MKSSNPKRILTAMLGACFFACNPSSDPVETSQGPVAPAESESGFDRSAIAIKAGPYSQKEKTAALRALASRYGHIVAPQADAGPAPTLGEAENPEAGALAKTAAIRYRIMKLNTFGNNFILMLVVQVKANQTVTAWTTRPRGSTADPFIVATYPTANGAVAGQLTRVVGLNDDDAGTLDSRFSWKNRTGSSKWLHIIAFAYTPELSGTATLSATVDGADAGSMTDYMNGIAVYDDNFNTLPIEGCSSPYAEKLTLQVIQSSDYVYGAMMVNAQTMTGAVLYTTSGLDNASIDIPTPTPSGYPNFMLLFATAQEIGSKVGSFRARQDQLFTCTF